MNDVLLQIKDLKVIYELDKAVVKAIDGVSFDIHKGICIGLVGESGSGKTTVAKAMLRLLPPNGRIDGGSILLKGRNITNIPEQQMESIRWNEISLVTQSAMNALNPVARISSQMKEIFLAHAPASKEDLLKNCMELFEKVGLNRNRIFDYPHQFSGGMRQRVIIAMAIALNPALIIADEPTTALDVIMQCQIINLLKRLSIEKNLSIMLITHDISIVAQICQTVAVMYAGRFMEYGDVYKVFNNPFHPYTMGLKGAFPSIKELKKNLISIPGSPPVLIKEIRGCGFADRCPFAVEKCRREVPELTMIEENHSAACHRTEHAARFRGAITEIFATQSGA